MISQSQLIGSSRRSGETLTVHFPAITPGAPISPTHRLFLTSHPMLHSDTLRTTKRAASYTSKAFSAPIRESRCRASLAAIRTSFAFPRVTQSSGNTFRMSGLLSMSWMSNLRTLSSSRPAFTHAARKQDSTADRARATVAFGSPKMRHFADSRR